MLRVQNNTQLREEIQNLNALLVQYEGLAKSAERAVSITETSIKAEEARLEIMIKEGDTAAEGEELFAQRLRDKRQEIINLKETLSLQQKIQKELKENNSMGAKILENYEKWKQAAEDGLAGQLALNKASAKFDKITTSGMNKLIGSFKDMIFTFNQVDKAFLRTYQLNQEFQDSMEETFKTANIYGCHS